MKELKLEELSLRQKLGMCMCARVGLVENEEDNNAFILEMIRARALGSVWISPPFEHTEAMIARIRAVADYPILILRDAETGIDGHTVGNHNAIGCADSEESAYTFGKVLGVLARQKGYNGIGDPILDIVTKNTVCGTTIRSLGSDKHRVAALAAAMARGLHDGGILTIGKHYPGILDGSQIDTHMAEDVSRATEAELLEHNLYPYFKLMEEGLLDGIMTDHVRYPNIDPDYPASLSPRVIGIIRKQGFDGFAITDALIMGGVTAKFGVQGCKGLSIAGGNDIALTWGPNRESYRAICDSYEAGIISDRRLDEAVRRVLEAQHKSLRTPVYTELTPEDLDRFESINRDAVAARCDEGIRPVLPKDRHHYFVVLAENETELSDSGKVHVVPFGDNWFDPMLVAERLQSTYPGSYVRVIHQFPTSSQVCRVMEDSLSYDDVVLVTFFRSQGYIGRECLTSRVIAMAEALQVTNRISTVLHWGNPFVLEELPHIPRMLIGSASSRGVSYGLDVLEGKCPAAGKLTYDVRFQ